MKVIIKKVVEYLVDGNYNKVIQKRGNSDDIKSEII